MLLRVLAAILALSVTAGCAQGRPSTDGRLRVVVAFYPLQYLVEQIGGPQVTVTNLTKPGAEPHDIELSPRQVGSISDAALVVYLKGFQPAVDQAVGLEAPHTALNADSSVELQSYPGGGGTDPHVWLDPVRFAAIAETVGDRLAQVDPPHAAAYAARTAAVRRELGTLDQQYARALHGCARRQIVSSHAAFGYLAARYGLTEIGITGVSPESEPALGTLIRIAKQSRAAGVTTIFFETLVSPKVAETLADEIGARAAVLDPLEGVSKPGADYFSVMRDNLAALTLALGCGS